MKTYSLLPSSYVGHFLPTKYDIHKFRLLFSHSWKKYDANIQLGLTLPVGSVLDHEQLHCTTGLLLQRIGFIYGNKVCRQKFCS